MLLYLDSDCSRHRIPQQIQDIVTVRARARVRVRARVRARARVNPSPCEQVDA